MIYDKDGNVLNAVYDKNGIELEKAYDSNGVVIYSKEVDYSSYTKSSFCSVNLSPTQAFDIHSGVIFQFMADSSSISNRMATINSHTSSIINSNVSSVSEHGDSASFSNEYYDASDEYPLLYVTADTNPAKVYVNRVTENSSLLVKTYLFPLDKTGYYSALAFDEENQIMYMLGYSEQNYLTDNDGANKTVISKWNMANLTQNQDGTFTPEFISSMEMPFIYCMQGLQFHDGMIWVSSGGTNHAGYIYALSPSDGTILHTIDLETTAEVEGLAWLDDNNIAVGYQGGTYEKITFGNI